MEGHVLTATLLPPRRAANAWLWCVLLLSLSACSGLNTRPAASGPEPVAAEPPSVVDVPQVTAVPDTVKRPPAPPPTVEAKPDIHAPTGAAVLQRLSMQMAEPDYCDRAAVVKSKRQLLGQSGALAQKVERVMPMLDYVLGAMERANLPAQFALIPWAESGFRADPGNRGTVQGLWQFTESTGRAHGLRINRVYDGRRAAIDSTAAAVDHLRQLQDRFSDWRLSLLAYNAGEYRVARSVSRSSKRSKSLPKGLAPHSYAYLHKITALACLLRDPAAAGIEVELGAFDRMQTLERPPHIDSSPRLAAAFGIGMDELLLYNAAFRNGEIADEAPLAILLPTSIAKRQHQGLRTNEAAAQPGDTLALSEHADRRLSTETNGAQSAVHVVVSGDTLWRIARRYRIALADLMRLNRLSRSSVIRPGQHLRVQHD